MGKTTTIYQLREEGKTIRVEVNSHGQTHNKEKYTQQNPQPQKSHTQQNRACEAALPALCVSKNAKPVHGEKKTTVFA